MLNPLPTGLSGAGQGSWSPATPWASPTPPGLSLPTAKGLSGLAAQPAGITPASGKSRAVCRGPGTMEWPHPRTTQAGAHTWLHPQRPQDVPVPQNLCARGLEQEAALSECASSPSLSSPAACAYCVPGDTCHHASGHRQRGAQEQARLWPRPECFPGPSERVPGAAGGRWGPRGWLGGPTGARGSAPGQTPPLAAFTRFRPADPHTSPLRKDGPGIPRSSQGLGAGPPRHPARPHRPTSLTQSTGHPRWSPNQEGPASWPRTQTREEFRTRTAIAPVGKVHTALSVTQQAGHTW